MLIRRFCSVSVIGVALLTMAIADRGWPNSVVADEAGLVGHWPLRRDVQDHSGHSNHGIGHGAGVETGEFNGRDARVEIPHSPNLRMGTTDFAMLAWIHTERKCGDAIGDIVTKFDAHGRNGWNLSLAASAAGYNSSGDSKYVHFGIDSGTPGAWHDCGRPGGKTHNSDALTVFDGSLYAGVTDAPDPADWAHVFRYRGGRDWEDCGRVGSGKTRGVYAMVVHDGALYAATSASHGVQPATMDFGRVYRYRGGTEWEDLGQPGAHYRLNSLATYRGQLYVCGFNIGTMPGYCYVYEGNRQWRPCGEFAGYPHTMAVHNDKLYVGYPQGNVFAYDGRSWQSLGNPFGSTAACSQIHSFGVFRGELFAGTWPLGKVAVLRQGKWVDAGHPGDATEVIALVPYNGTFYAGTIPRAEVFRYVGGQEWRSLRRLFTPPGFQPVPVGSGDKKGVADWSRTTSMTVFAGKLFASTGTCYRTMIDPPLTDETRGNVYAFESGGNVSFDRDLGTGWKHVAAVRQAQRLSIFVDGQRVAQAELDQPNLDLSNTEPLQIGFGQTDYFCGMIRDVRLYKQALEEKQIQAIFRQRGYQ
jgi:hypothetical protein